MAILPPIPYDRPQTSFEWIDWYTKLNQVVNNSTDHNNLSNIQGGLANEHYHLSQTQYNQLTGGGITSLHSHPGGGGGSELPVGTYYLSNNSTNPSVTLGYGTWVLQPYTL
jgi:hypothetical protein